MMQHGNKADWNVCGVSYWEWAKLGATSLAISIATTSTAFAIWWWFLK
jgi:hypothetical protein